MKKVILFTTLLLLGIISCSKNEEKIVVEEKIIEPPKFENINPAQNNGDIISQKILGKGSINKSIIINNTIYAIGYEAGEKFFIKKMSKSGEEIWSKSIENIHPRTLSQINDNSIIVIGGTRGGATPKSQGVIQIYDLNGVLLSEEKHYKEDYGFYFRSICKLSENEFVLGGTQRRFKSGERDKPFLKYIDIQDNKITYSCIIDIEEDFDRHSVVGVSAIGDDELIVLMQKQNDNSAKRSLIISKLGNTSDNKRSYASGQTECITSMDVIWKKEVISSNNLNITNDIGKQLIINADKIFVISNTYDVKEPSPSKGNWTSGLVFCLDLNGNILWKNNINISNKDDKLYRGIFYNSNLFIVGKHSSYMWSPQKIYNSNGLLLKMDTYGEIKYIKTFGDKKDSQGFYTIEIINDKLKLLGYKGLKNWIVEVNP